MSKNFRQIVVADFEYEIEPGGLPRVLCLVAHILNEHLEHNDGTEIFVHACRLGLAGILSKRQDSRATAQAASLTGLGQRIQMHLQ